MSTPYWRNLWALHNNMFKFLKINVRAMKTPGNSCTFCSSSHSSLSTSEGKSDSLSSLVPVTSNTITWMTLSKTNYWITTAELLLRNSPVNYERIIIYTMYMTLSYTVLLNSFKHYFLTGTKKINFWAWPLCARWNFDVHVQY